MNPQHASQYASDTLAPRLESIVRAKLNDATARIVRWQRNRDGSETPIWITIRPTAARALGLHVSSMADDYGQEPCA